ncbi:MAG: hypothetical protein M3134_08385 [Actinomycetota bacterium]|nr:hypothetical protein [Actinomycetota bacterium]
MKKTTFLLLAMLASVLPIPSAVAAPQIAFLNPSSYQGTQPYEISDVMDADGNVHLVAWARDIPSSALVEFELERTGDNPATFTAERVGQDTWEALVPIPDSYPDGATYTLRARLYAGVPGDADEVANDEVTVEVNQSPVPPPPGASVEMTYPDNGGVLGVFSPKGKQSVAVFDYAASAGTEQVRAFYTLSDPGVDPVVWEDACGSSTPVEGFGKVRCTLKEGVNPLDVTAVAVVSNRAAPAPPAPPNPALDAAGDAHRVFPYAQQPRTVEVAGGTGNLTLSECHMLTATVEDQNGRPVALANVDVHADGPEDELHFGTRSTGAAPQRTDGFQAPDVQHVSKENAKDCADDTNENQQGDHNSPGRDDLKHIESTTGSSNSGEFRFALHSDFAGGTFVQVWADVDDDDLPDLNEATGGAQLGWASPMPEAPQEVFVTPTSANGTNGSCVELEIIARRGGGAFNNANVDVHIQGPDPAVTFCDVTGGGTRRSPESGGHLGDAHEDGTKHAEGETGPAGTFKFGITSATSGTTQVQVWIDRDDDDTLNNEPSKTATVSWAPAGDRTISLSSSKSRVAQGRRVRLFGQIDGDPTCSGGQAVDIQSKPVRGGRFGTVKTVVTEADGSYSTRIKMFSARKFRAVAPAGDPCSFARSNTVTVRVRRS